MSAARSLLRLVSSDVVVCHREAAAGLARLTKSGRAGRAAVAQCGAVLPLMTAALKGDAKQRAAAMAALGALAEGDPSNDPDPERDDPPPFATRPSKKAPPWTSRETTKTKTKTKTKTIAWTTTWTISTTPPACTTRRRRVPSRGGRSRRRRPPSTRRRTRGLEGRRARRTEAAGGMRSSWARRRRSARRSSRGSSPSSRRSCAFAGRSRAHAADASLALWALAWQPSNRAAMVRDVVEPLVDLYAEARHPKKAKAPSEAAASEDAGAALSVLARVDAEARARSRWRRAAAARGGGTLGARGRESGAEPQGRRGRRGGTRNAGVRPRTGGSRGEEKAQRRGDVAEHSAHHKQRPRLRRVGERRPEMTRPRERVERGRARATVRVAAAKENALWFDGRTLFTRRIARCAGTNAHVIYHII